MKLIILLLLLFVITTQTQAQKRQKQFSLSVLNMQSAMPFAKFSGLFYKPFHPGVEAGMDFNWKTRSKHDWFQEFKLGYFFHRFVQHGIPVYTDFGYRYKFSRRISSDILIGGGYLHSIPATAKLKLNKDGEYENNKGMGRSQGMATFGLKIDFKIHPSAARPLTIFSQYQQWIQMPFVRSYVPLLPYNSFSIGIRRSFKSK